MLKTCFPPGTKVSCEPLLGMGQAFNAEVDYNSGVPFELKEKNSFALYEYTVLK